MVDYAMLEAKGRIYPGALTGKEKVRLKFHTHADNERSSQVFCLNAFGTLRLFPERDEIINRLFRKTLNGIEPGTWTIQPEASERTLLGESGQQPTSIDMLFTSEKMVICMESKYIEDAKSGFGGCSQYKDGNCRGFYGPGSDKKCGTQAWCRLENRDGKRSPRLYWSLGKAYFQPEVFRMQTEEKESCHFFGPNYQLMRNVLFAATFAEKHSLPYWGVVAICPEKNKDSIEKQIDQFKERILLPEFHDRLNLIHYEDYIQILKSYEGEPSKLGNYLEAHLPK